MLRRMKYKLIITEKAEELLDNIINKLKNPQVAGNILTEIEHVYTNLVCNPGIFITWNCI